MNIPVQAVFLIIAWVLDLGHMGFNWWFVLVYFMVSMVCVSGIFIFIFKHSLVAQGIWWRKGEVEGKLWLGWTLSNIRNSVMGDDEIRVRTIRYHFIWLSKLIQDFRLIFSFCRVGSRYLWVNRWPWHVGSGTTTLTTMSYRICKFRLCLFEFSMLRLISEKLITLNINLHMCTARPLSM